MITAQSVRSLFDKSGIKNVAIIDDVFDPPGSNLSPAEIETLFEKIGELPGLAATLRGSEQPVREPADLVPAVLSMIKGLADDGDEDAAEFWAMIDHIATNKRAKLETLAANLRRNLKVSVKKIPAAAAARKRNGIVPEDSNVIFLDYELEAGRHSSDLSSSIVDKIYKQFKGKAAAPLLILMSSLDLGEEKVADFQKRSDFLSGMFYFVPKSDLFEVEKLHYRLAAFAKALPTGQTLQKFIERLDDSLSAARASVFNDLRSLNIADYAFLQTMRLHDDGQPMGEYLMWMISAHLVKELGADVAMKDVEKTVSGLSFNDLPPTNARPSPSLGALYSSAVMRKMDPLPDPAVDPTNYLQFGDLFLKNNSKTVLVCITPPCDLAFGATRKIPSDRSILFLTGKLMPIEKALKPFEQRQPRTELVRLDDTMSRIVWDTKRVVQMTWGDLRNKLTQMKANRVARLNTAFALEIQRSFATDLTRIGMPVAPPVYNPIDVEMICLDEDGKDKILTTQATCKAHLSGSDRGEKLVMGAEFMDALPGMLAQATALLEARHKALMATTKLQGPGKAAEIAGAKDKLIATRKDANALSAIRGPFGLAGDGLPQSVLDDLLEIRDGADSAPIREWVPLRIRLIREQDVEQPA